tara:strand:- start:515 stop:835 length:321 start_codon:yes stop_codon:yes gene_type:complete
MVVDNKIKDNDMISSKIGTKDSWKISRLDSKEEYIEYVLDALASEQELGYSGMFKNLLLCDEEMKYDIGFDDDSVEWYEKHIRKQLNKLDTTALAFIYNCLEYPKQ